MGPEDAHANPNPNPNSNPNPNPNPNLPPRTLALISVYLGIRGSPLKAIGSVEDPSTRLTDSTPSPYPHPNLTPTLTLPPTRTFPRGSPMRSPPKMPR